MSNEMQLHRLEILLACMMAPADLKHWLDHYVSEYDATPRMLFENGHIVELSCLVNAYLEHRPMLQTQPPQTLLKF